MRIAILTDSSFDGNMNDYKNLFLAPLPITRENGEIIKNNNTLTNEIFYDLLSNEVLKTSQTPVGEMLSIWTELLKENDQIIYLPISKGLSGQFSTYRMMSETEEEFKGRVFVCDTNAVSVVLQEMIKKVAYWIAENKTGFEILELVKEESNKFYGFIMPKVLDTLKRGGRISPAAAALGKILKIVPILSYNGYIDKHGTARTIKKAIEESCSLIKKEIKHIKEVDVAYSQMDEEELKKIFTDIEHMGLKINRKSELTKVIAAHTGPKTFAIVGWKK